MDHKIIRFAEKTAFIIFKDHKINFKNKKQCRLINPAKSEMGIFSKHILERVNNEIRKTTHFKQWRCTSSVIDWFLNASKTDLNIAPDMTKGRIRQNRKIKFFPGDYFAILHPVIYSKFLKSL